MVGAGAGFHTDEARRQCRDEFEQLGTRHTGAHQRRLACGINAMNSKDVLGEIDTDGDNGRYGLPLPQNECVDEMLHFPSWHLDAVPCNYADRSGLGSPFYSLSLMSQVVPSIDIRRLTADDAAAFSALRREITRENPVPMGLTFEEELTRTLDGFRAQLSSPLPNVVFGSFVEGELVATAAVSRASQFPSSHHKMVMWGVFTSHRHRRRGLSRQVVNTALQHAFDNGVHRVNLQVYLPNEPATTLYKAIGFVEYGMESEAVCLDGLYYDGVHMTLVKHRHNKPLHPTAFCVG